MSASGETLRFRDAAGRKRSLRVVSATEHGLLVESDKTAYVTPKTLLHRAYERTAAKSRSGILGRSRPKKVTSCSAKEISCRSPGLRWRGIRPVTTNMGN